MGFRRVSSSCRDATLRPSQVTVARLVVSLLMAMAAGGCGGSDQQAPSSPGFSPEILALPAPPPAFEEMPVPAGNAMTPEKVALGRQLFFDKRLSGDGVRSCHSCHVCDEGLTDGLPAAIGAFGKPLPRSSPTLWNIGYHAEYGWDGRSPSLEDQALATWSGASMGANPDEVVATLNDIAGYRDQFQKVFGGPATPGNVVQALSAFERTILCGDTAFDRFSRGDASALSESAQRGWSIWREKAGCAACHAGILFTDLRYHNVGIGMDEPDPDAGRANVTRQEKDTGAFKTPTLRDIARSAPYFHDGSVATLEEAVDLMLGGGVPGPYLDAASLEKVTLTPEEKAALIEFLKSLACECRLEEPPLPPSPFVM